eukprot:2584776-Pyramimonas_sp.AAC.1
MSPASFDRNEHSLTVVEDIVQEHAQLLLGSSNHRRRSSWSSRGTHISRPTQSQSSSSSASP